MAARAMAARAMAAWAIAARNLACMAPHDDIVRYRRYCSKVVFFCSVTAEVAGQNFMRARYVVYGM